MKSIAGISQSVPERNKMFTKGYGRVSLDTVLGKVGIAVRPNMPCGITPGSGDLPLQQPKLVLDFTTPEGCKVELT